MRMYMFLGRPVYYVDMSGLVRRHYTFKLECIKKKYTSPRTVVSNVRPASNCSKVIFLLTWISMYKRLSKLMNLITSFFVVIASVP